MNPAADERPAPPADPRANPLAGNPLRTRTDVARAVVDLYQPLLPYLSPGGARARLGSFGAGFEVESAELEGFARPLYGIVPLTVGGGEFAHWDRVVDGLRSGTDPDSPEYWGTITRDADQRMVEQAALGLALAFCPDRTWEPLDTAEQGRLVRWLHGVFDHDPVRNNWQFFRVLVALGLERVGAAYDEAKVVESLDLLDTWRVGEHGYVDGDLGNVDHYVPMAFHTYGLFYAAANDLGLGDDGRAEAFRERAAGFAADFAHWFGPDGAAMAMGRSLTYRFAVSSFWGALAWADVAPDGLTWGEVRGLALRNLRWWSHHPISDRDGVLSVGYAYDNRRLCESYNSAGSPYWCAKAFAGLAAPADHPFWTDDEAPLPALDRPIALPDAGWVVQRDDVQAVALVASTGFDMELPEQASAKYRKFAYSTAFPFSGDCPDFLGRIATDSMLALTDDDGFRRVRLGVDAAGIETVDGLDVVWSTWRPFGDVRVDSVTWFDPEDPRWHGRLHRLRTGRALDAVESGFALGCAAADAPADLTVEAGPGAILAGSVHGRSAIADATLPAAIAPPDGSAPSPRVGSVHRSAVNANLLHPQSAVPVLRRKLAPGDHLLAGAVRADVVPFTLADAPAVPETVVAVLGRIADR